jgi:hypothetical protein
MWMHILSRKIPSMDNRKADLKGLGREKDLIFGQKLTVNKYLFWFLNLQDAPLMRCRHCHFPRGLGENISEN